MRSGRSWGAIVFLLGTFIWIAYRAGQHFFQPTYEAKKNVFNIQPETHAANSRTTSDVETDKSEVIPLKDNTVNNDNADLPANSEISPEISTKSTDSPTKTLPKEKLSPENTLKKYAGFSEKILALSENLTGSAARLQSEGGNLIINLKFQKPMRCSAGDYTAIKKDLNANIDLRLMATVDSTFEPGEKIGKTLAHIDLDFQNLDQRALVIPRKKAIRVLGIYLCASARGVKRCAKGVTSIDKILKQHQQRRLLREAGKNPPRIPNKRTYFFAPMLISGNDAILLTQDDMRATSLENLISKWPNPSPGRLRKLRRAFRSMRKNMKTLNSEMISFADADQSITITLPDFAQEACEK